jgi:hypothetical protein
VTIPAAELEKECPFCPRHRLRVIEQNLHSQTRKFMQKKLAIRHAGA